MAESYRVKAILSASDDGFSSAMKGAIKQSEKLESAMSGGLGFGIMAGIGQSAFQAVTGSAKAFVSSIIDTGSEFQSQMSRVQAISGATGQEFEKLRKQALQLGADTSFSASSVAEGMENLSAAGFTVNETISAMPGLLDMAAASGEDLASSSDIAASTLRGFGLAASDMGHVADVLAENANKTNAAVADTGDAMKYVAPLARAAGISFEETAAAIGIMSNAGIKGTQAGTTLRGALARLSKPTDEMTAAMQELGISFYDSDGKMKSLSEQVGIMQSALGGLTEEEKNNYLVTLYGQEALSGMTALINEGSGTLSSLTKSYENCDGAAQKAADTMLNNFGGAMEQLKGSIETLGITIFDSMSGGLTKLANFGTEVINSIVEGFENGGVAGAFQSVFTLIEGQFSSWLPQMIQQGYNLVLNFSEGFASGFPGVLSKVLDFIQGIGEKLAAAAPVFISKGFEILSNLVRGISEALPMLIAKVPEIISTFANIINDNFPTILMKGVELIGQLIMGIIQAIPTLVANIPQIVTAIVDVIQAFNWLQLGSKIITLFKNGIMSMIGVVKGAGKSIYDAVHNMIRNLPNTLSNIGKAAANGFANMLRTGIALAKNAAVSIGNAIVSAIKSIPGKMISIGKNIVTGLWDGISGMVGWITDKVMGFANSVIGGIKNALGIHSPSRVMRDEVGKYMALGMGIGFERNLPISDMATAVDRAVKHLAGDSQNFKIPVLPRISTPSLAGVSGGDWELSNDYSYTKNAKYTIVVPVNIDGKETARVTAPYTEAQLNKREKLNKMINGIR